MSSIFDELPAPVRPKLTEEQKYRRRRRFAVVLNWFVLGYSVLHKLVLPLYVSFAHSSSFAILDWWWVYHAALGLLLLRKEWDDLPLRLFLFFGAGGAICQILVSFLERNWHSVSLWVTSASTLWVVFFLLNTVKSRFPEGWGMRKPVFQAAALAMGFLAQFALFGFTFSVEKTAKQALLTPSLGERFPVLRDSDVCGVPGFSLPLDGGSPRLPELRSANDVAVKDCGFPAAALRFDASKPLTVRNATRGYLNVKLYVPFGGRWRPLQNMPLPPGLDHELSPAQLAGHPVALLASDADPKKGLLLMVADPSAFSDAVKSASDGGGKTAVEIDRKGLEPY